MPFLETDGEIKLGYVGVLVITTVGFFVLVFEKMN